MRFPWLLAASGLALLVFAVVDPSVLAWLVLGAPLLLVVVPTAFPPLERRINRRIDRAIERRKQTQQARHSKPSDPTAGLSYPSDDASGRLTVTEPGPKDVPPTATR